jgi:hypothetical protein
MVTKLDLHIIPVSPNLPDKRISSVSSLDISTDMPRSDNRSSTSSLDKSGSDEVTCKPSIPGSDV